MANPQCDTPLIVLGDEHFGQFSTSILGKSQVTRGGEGGGGASPLTAPEVHEVSVVHRKSVIVIVMNTKFADNKNDRKWVTGRERGRQGVGFVSARAVCHIGIRGWRVTESCRKGVIKLVLEMYVCMGKSTGSEPASTRLDGKRSGNSFHLGSSSLLTLLLSSVASFTTYAIKNTHKSLVSSVNR